MSNVVDAVEREFDADVIAFFGPFSRDSEDLLRIVCRARRLRTNVMLILASSGGDPGAAYKIARCLQHAYKTVQNTTAGHNPAGQPQALGRFDVAVDTVCKSAGTLLCLGAGRLFMSPDAELGPIDIQLRKPDEVGERTSGLTPLQALDTLKTQSLSLFKHHFTQLRFDGDLVFSTRTAAEIATKLTVGLMGHVYGQIDPMRLAEVERAIRISSEYGSRIAVNLKSDGLARLLADYPSHGFVIDRREACSIFNEVHEPSSSLAELMSGLRNFSARYMDADSPFFAYLSDEPEAGMVSQAPTGDAANEQQPPKDDGPSAPAPGCAD